jgi:hypothetical protein
MDENPEQIMEQIKSQSPAPNDYIHRRANARLHKCLGIIYKAMLGMVPRVSASSEEMQEHACAHGSSVFTDACHCFPDYGDDDKVGDHHPIRHALIAMIVAYNEHNGLRDITAEDIKQWKHKYYARARSMAFTDISNGLMDSLKGVINHYDSPPQNIGNLLLDLKQLVEEYE